MKKIVIPEDMIYNIVADFMCNNYPNIPYHFDYGSGLYMTKGQAAKQKRINKHRGWPDLFIASPKVELDNKHPSIVDQLAGKWDSLSQRIKITHGLFIEIKREDVRLKKKNGEWTSPHIQEQAEMLKLLNGQGYAAAFACGEDEVIKAIKDYLGDGKEDVTSDNSPF